MSGQLLALSSPRGERLEQAFCFTEHLTMETAAYSPNPLPASGLSSLRAMLFPAVFQVTSPSVSVCCGHRCSARPPARRGSDTPSSLSLPRARSLALTLSAEPKYSHILFCLTPVNGSHFLKIKFQISPRIPGLPFRPRCCPAVPRGSQECWTPLSCVCGSVHAARPRTHTHTPRVEPHTCPRLPYRGS